MPCEDRGIMDQRASSPLSMNSEKKIFKGANPQLVVRPSTVIEAASEVAGQAVHSPSPYTPVVAADASLTFGSPPLPDDSERYKVLNQWNDTEAEFPADKCVHEMF